MSHLRLNADLPVSETPLALRSSSIWVQEDGYWDERLQETMIDHESERPVSPCCSRGTSGCEDQRRGRVQGFSCTAIFLLAICASVNIVSSESDPYGANDVGVHRVSLYRKGGPEDKDSARRERNVLVSCKGSCKCNISYSLLKPPMTTFKGRKSASLRTGSLKCSTMCARSTMEKWGWGRRRRT